MLKHPENAHIDSSLASAVQLILAEKRTSLALMRTGIAVFALPVSVLSILVATSKLYHFSNVAHFLIPLLSLCLGLVLLGIYLIVRAVLRIRRCDNSVTTLKRSHPQLSDVMR
ncbi:MAG: hypothetical protein ACE5EO_12240 [Candidatus Krumholzibacteriia bacterium]